MPTYEIRVVKPDGIRSLVYASQFLNDIAAIRSTELIAHEKCDIIEIGDGKRCVHRAAGFAWTG